MLAEPRTPTLQDFQAALYTTLHQYYCQKHPQETIKRLPLETFEASIPSNEAYTTILKKIYKALVSLQSITENHTLPSKALLVETEETLFTLFSQIKIYMHGPDCAVPSTTNTGTFGSFLESVESISSETAENEELEAQKSSEDSEVDFTIIDVGLSELLSNTLIEPLKLETVIQNRVILRQTIHALFQNHALQYAVRALSHSPGSSTGRLTPMYSPNEDDRFGPVGPFHH